MNRIKLGLNRGLRGIVVLFCVVFSPLGMTQDVELENLQKAQGIVDLHLCQEKTLGLEILCNRKWVQDVGKNSIVLTISEDPAVLLTVVRLDEVITGIDELLPSKLKKLGKYAQGFTIEKTQVAKNPAVRVEGYTVDYPEVQLQDWYVIHDYQLYAFMFSVNPKQEWSNFAVLFAKIIDSIKFVDNKN